MPEIGDMVEEYLETVLMKCNKCKIRMLVDSNRNGVIKYRCPKCGCQVADII